MRKDLPYCYAVFASAAGILVDRSAPGRIPIVFGVAGVTGAIVLFDLAIRWHAEHRTKPNRPVILGPELTASLNRPNIQQVRLVADRRTLIAVGANAPHAFVHCASAIFKNVPTPGSHPDAHVSDVLAEIKFLRHGRVALTTSPGRWGDTEQPAVRKARDPFASLIDLNAISFRIGEEHELNIAIKHPAQAFFYAFNNQTYDHPNWENPAYRLDGDAYEVVVRLFGRNVDEGYRFVLRNLGTAAGLQIALPG
jgi:hypothetical protein